MSIEVASLPDSQRLLPIKRSVVFLFDFARCRVTGIRGKLLLVILLGLITPLTILISLFAHSYAFYARLIDARLASGYLTSRPGLYAAPKLLQVGQRQNSEQLENALRRAGYVEGATSEVWNGSFIKQPGSIEIRNGKSIGNQPKVVRVVFKNDSVVELTGDGVGLESFQLEPEPLANDLSSKAGEREILTYGEIPSTLVQAILSIEDRRFFEHPGLDISGLFRALVRNAGDERIGQGGSTITQQLIKNTYLSPEKTLQRKYSEAVLALALERRLSKQDIFALYCNEIYLGQRGALGVRGMKQGARVFFAKDLKDLTVPEAATLAGMIQGPTRYSPVRHPDASLTRRNVVLASMQRDGWISEQQLQEASASSITVAPPPDADDSLAPYFVDYVSRVAEEQFDASGSSQRIYTTIDLDLQRAADAALKKQLERLDSVYSNRNVTPQVALIALDPHSGNVLAMTGGRSYAASQFNRATDALRQPGSTFKPFVYAAALEDGMSPVQTLVDAPREFVYDRDKVYRPANYGGGYSMHEVMLRTGLIKSLNVVTVDVALQTGLARIANLATRFGLPKPERYPSLALGTKEVTPLQLASAYATFVNDGIHLKPKVITGVDEPPAVHVSTSGEQVISPTTAYMITNMLAGVIDRGTARSARGAVKGSVVAGKTGTSHDGWFVGYSPNLVCAVWIGFDDNAQLGLTGADAALPAWVDFMNSAIALRPDLGGTGFECPEGIEFVEVDSATGLLATVGCPLREVVAVTERSAPHVECYLHESMPTQTSPFADESEEKNTIVVAQHSKSKVSSVSDENTNYRTTRVDVDVRGRRTLVNDIR